MTGIPPPTLTSQARNELRARLRSKAREFLERFYRHDVLVARAVRGIQTEAVQVFRRDVGDPLIREIAASLAGFDPRGQAVTPQAYPELAAMIREAEAIVRRGVEQVQRITEERMRAVAETEAEFVQRNAEKSADEPVPEANTAQATRQPFLGDDTERWFQKMLVEPTGDGVRQRITQGIQQGLTVDQIVRSIRGTRTQTGVLDRSAEAVATLVRTAATSASANARTESFKEIGVTHWLFVATLDSRTSLQCAANDGKRFPVGEGPLPPLHPNCRSTAVPDFGGEPEGTRASTNAQGRRSGQVPASTNFEGWLGARSIREQDEVLGAARAKAWRAGKLTLKQMLGRDMQPLTLENLRELDRI